MAQQHSSLGVGVMHGPWFCSASKACQEALSLFLERGALLVSSFCNTSFLLDVCLSVHGHILILACLSQLNSEADSTIPWSTSEFRNEQRRLRFRVAAWSLQSAHSSKDGATSRPWSTGGNSIDMHHGSCSSSSLVACSFFSNLKPEMDQST